MATMHVYSMGKGEKTIVLLISTIAFPKEIPVLKLISSQSLKKVGNEYQTNHLNRLGAKVESKIIDSSHFIYQKNVVDIFEATGALIEKITCQH